MKSELNQIKKAFIAEFLEYSKAPKFWALIQAKRAFKAELALVISQGTLDFSAIGDINHDLNLNLKISDFN